MPHSPKRLLALTHAGVLEVNRALFQEFARVADADVTLVVPESWRGDLIRDLKYSPGDSDRGIRNVALPTLWDGNGSLYVYRRSLGRLARELRPDHVFVDEEPWSLAALQAAHAFRGSQLSFFTKQNIAKRLPPPFPIIERYVYGRSSHAYVVADEVGQVLRAKGYTKPIRFLPHSYDPKLFRSLPPDERATVRHSLGKGFAPSDALLIGYFGRLTVEKGIEDLLAALPQILASTPHARVLVVGSGPLEGQVREAVTSLGPDRARWMPAIPHLDVGRTLAACDLLVLPSRTTPAWKEQYGRILVEAMACGTAVLGSDSGEIPHLIRRTGGGDTFHERDPGDLAQKASTLARDHDRRARLAAAGQRYVETHLTHEAVAQLLARDLGFGTKTSQIQ